MRSNQFQSRQWAVVHNAEGMDLEAIEGWAKHKYEEIPLAERGERRAGLVPAGQALIGLPKLFIEARRARRICSPQPL